MANFQFWKITVHGRVLLYLRNLENARINDFPLEVSDNVDLTKHTLEELQNEEFISSEFREDPIGEYFFLTSKGRHIANVLHYSVDIPLSKAQRSIQHLLK